MAVRVRGNVGNAAALLLCCLCTSSTGGRVTVLNSWTLPLERLAFAGVVVLPIMSGVVTMACCAWDTLAEHMF